MQTIIRNIASIDLETTGTNPSTDRIVQIAVVLYTPDMEQIGLPMVSLINPGIPIPPEATKTHGITDEMVQADGVPTFEEIGPSIFQVLNGLDLLGYNIIKFDVPMLVEEFFRIKINFNVNNIRLIDVFVSFCAMHPRTLSAAYMKYIGKELNGAHDASIDALATTEIMMKQLEVHDEINSIDDIVEMAEPQNRCDLAGKIVKKEGIPVFTFGPHKDKPVTEELGFLKWMLAKDFPEETKRWIDDYLKSLV